MRGFLVSISVLIVLTLGMTVLVPIANKIRHQRQEAQIVVDLHRLGIAMVVYEAEHGGDLPATLDQLGNKLAENSTRSVERSEESSNTIHATYLGCGKNVDRVSTNDVAAIFRLGSDSSGYAMLCDGSIVLVRSNEITNVAKVGHLQSLDVNGRQITLSSNKK